MKRRQKIFLGAFLCLSVCTIIIASVRVIGFHIRNTYVAVWAIFWAQTEAAIAIIMVSTTAFRSLLGLKAQKAQKKKVEERYWIGRRPQQLQRARYFNKKKATEDNAEYEQLSSISLGATPPTGMRTSTTDGERRIGYNSMEMGMEMAYQSEEDTAGATSHKPQEIEGAHHISTASNTLDGAESSRDANLFSN